MEPLEIFLEPGFQIPGSERFFYSFEKTLDDGSSRNAISLTAKHSLRGHSKRCFQKRCLGCNPGCRDFGGNWGSKVRSLLRELWERGGPFTNDFRGRAAHPPSFPPLPPGWFRPSAINRRFCSLSITARAGITVITREMAAVWKKEEKGIPAEKYSEKPIPRRSNSLRVTLRLVCACACAILNNFSRFNIVNMEEWDKIHSTTQSIYWNFRIDLSFLGEEVFKI